MKSITIITTFFTIVVLGLGSAAAADSPTTKATVMTGLTSMPLAFTENQGQWDDQVLFRANGGGATMWFTRDGAYYQFTRRISSTNGENPPQGVGHPGVGNCKDLGTPPLAVGSHDLGSGRQMSTSAPFTDHEPDSLETMMIKAAFVGANPNPRMVGEEMIEYKCNYFLGNDPAKWRTDVPNYSAVVYEDIYPGIDLKYYGNGKQMEYDFVVSPGADFSQICIQYEGANSLSVDAAGRLVVETDWGEVIEQRPVVYQMSGGDRVSLAGEYILKGDNAFGFELTDGYNPELALVIDPVLTYSTYLGGSDYDGGYGIAVNHSGCAYVTGYTLSTDFPIINPYQTWQGGYDVFVTKLSSAGNSPIYSTYLGGDSTDWAYAIDIDSYGCAYVTGSTESSNFPTVNPYQTYQGFWHVWDVFVTKLSSAGDSLIYSTYLGGNADAGWWHVGIAVDKSGCAYVTGYTSSSDFPTVNPYQTYRQGFWDAFVTKMSSAGNSLIYSTYLGGMSDDAGVSVAVDTSGCAYVTGYTSSTDFPTVNPYQTDYQGGYIDVFVTKLSSAGSSVIYSTYLGGDSTDRVQDIAVDKFGCAYVMGGTYSSDFPTVNPYQTYQGGQDVFVTKLSSVGNSLIYSTYLEGSGWGGIAVDDFGCAYVTASSVTKLSSVGNSLIYSTYLGGNGGWGGIVVDDFGSAYVTGYTLSSNFPTVNPYQTYQGDGDVFVTKISDEVTSMDEIEISTLPDDFQLGQNYPNPFNPQTQFEFSLPHASHVKVEIFNVLGQQVVTLVDKSLPAGSYRVTWDGKDYVGREVSSGVYLYRLTTDEFAQSRKMMLLK